MSVVEKSVIETLKTDDNYTMKKQSRSSGRIYKSPFELKKAAREKEFRNSVKRELAARKANGEIIVICDDSGIYYEYPSGERKYVQE